ncbi:hypothetical protein PSEUDO8AS_10876 [Pseudomonas sp. 8AS]|nr:hypothetical protein PSEUDO8AS_10876 [Pseudomonas sp. 8AS]
MTGIKCRGGESLFVLPARPARDWHPCKARRSSHTEKNATEFCHDYVRPARRAGPAVRRVQQARQLDPP